MKNMKNINFKMVMLGALIVMLSGATVSKAQDSTASAPATSVNKPVKGTFSGPVLIDNQTVMVPNKGTFTFDFEHRFGNLNNYSDMYGLFNITSILLGFNYVPVKNVEVGFGLCSYNMTWDLNLKLALLRQAKTGGSPVSITYYGDVGIDSRDKSNFVSVSDRYTYFNEIMIARKITDKLSLQVAPNLSYFCDVPAYTDANGKIQSTMQNTQFAFSVVGRYKLSPTVAIIADYDQPLTQNPTSNPHPNLGGGIEFETSGHTFQLFLTNYGYCLPQYNYFLNQNDYTKRGGFLLGFNVTRF
jgi:hypothetical protein